MQLSLIFPIDAPEGEHFLPGFEVEYNFIEFFCPRYFFQQFFAVAFEAVVADEGLLHLVVLLSDELPHRQRQALLLGGRPGAAVQFDVQGADL